MPKKEDHLNCAEHNNSFWTSIELDSSHFIDWAITGMFYETVHWVEAFLAPKGYHSGKHAERAKNMRFFKIDLKQIQNDYDKLKQDSETARYDCYKHTANEARQLIPLVDNIKNHISQLL